MNPDDLMFMTPQEREAIAAKYYSEPTAAIPGAPGVNMSGPVPMGPQASVPASYYGNPEPPPRAPPPPPPPPPPPAGSGADALPPDIQAKLTGAFGRPPPSPAPAPPADALPEYDGSPIAKVRPNMPPAQARAEFAAAQKPPPDGGGGDGDVQQMAPVTVQGAPPPRMGGGGGGGFQINPALRQNFYATFPAEQAAVYSLAAAEQAKADALAAGMAVIGADRVKQSRLDEARIQHERDYLARYQDETQRQMDEVRSQTVDPNRLYRDGGAKAMAIIGGILGGLYQGINKLQSNPYIDQMNKMIDQDIAIQERQLERNAKAVNARHGILADMRATFKDNDLARAQTKALYYEGIKSQLAAEAAKYESPAIAARAAKTSNEIDRQLGALKLDEQAKQAAAAAAAAAFARAEEDRQWKRRLDAYNADTHRITALRSGAGHKEGQSPRERFVAVGQDKYGNPEGYLARNATEAAKATQHIEGSRELLRLIDEAQAVRKEAGFTGRLVNRGGPLLGAVPVYQPEWRSKLEVYEKQILGAIKKQEELGALDQGVERYGAPMAGNLATIGSSADDRLNALKAAVQSKLDVHQRQLAGQRAVMYPNEDVVMSGRANSPTNQVGTSGVQREK